MDMSVVGISEETKTLLEEIEFVAALLPRNKLPRNEIVSWERRKMKEEKKHWSEELFFREAESDVGGLLIIKEERNCICPENLKLQFHLQPFHIWKHLQHSK